MSWAGAVIATFLLSAAAVCGVDTDRGAGTSYAAERERMIDEQIVARGVRSPAVLDAMRRVPRHLFVPEAERALAYGDFPLPIAAGQTISQPYIVAYMSELLEVEPDHKVLEVGTGSGYQAAVLAELSRHVYSIEIIEELGHSAREALRESGYEAVHLRIGDGYRGWPEEAPFDRIIVTAAPDHIPPVLVDQLAAGGKIVIPVGSVDQEIIVITKSDTGVTQQRTIAVRFVPMTGEARNSGRQ